MTYVIRRNFFTAALAWRLRAMMLNEARYTPATVIGDAAWRAGRVAHIEGSPEAQTAAEEILRAVPAVCYALGIDAFAPSRCEVQLSRYGDGDYFRPHVDDGSPGTAARVLSWVVYLDLVKPREWTGGALRLIDYHFVDPEDGMVIFFPSSKYHEVLPVSVSGETWEKGRHTINGWVRR